MVSKSFDLDAGALCLDFANTAEWHASARPVERLNDISDLIEWGEAAGVFTAEEATTLRNQMNKEPAPTAGVFERAIRLREAIYRLYRDAAALSPSYVQETLDYLDDFYEVLDDPGRTARELVRRCRAEEGI